MVSPQRRHVVHAALIEAAGRSGCPFAKPARIIGGMSDVESARLFRKKRVRPYRGRGDVYSWLRTHHERVAELVPTWSWSDLVVEMLRDGLQGRGGVAPTAKAVTKVWQRVCRDVASEAASELPKPSKPPSRMSPDWRPQEVVQLPAPSSSPSRQVMVVGGAPATEPEFATVDPAGVPVAPGHVFYNGKTMLRHVAEQVARIIRTAREMDRGK